MGKHARNTLKVFPVIVSVEYGREWEEYSLNDQAQFENWVSDELETWIGRQDRNAAAHVIETLAKYVNAHGGRSVRHVIDSFGNVAKYTMEFTD